MSLKKDWSVISDLACEYTNYFMAGDEIAAKRKKRELVSTLKNARKEHGDVPIILETLADYTSNFSKKIDLLEYAFRLNIMGSNFNYALSCANSALSASMKQNNNFQVDRWKKEVRNYMSYSDDPDEVLEAEQLLSGEF